MNKHFVLPLLCVLLAIFTFGCAHRAGAPPVAPPAEVTAETGRGADTVFARLVDIEARHIGCNIALARKYETSGFFEPGVGLVFRGQSQQNYREYDVEVEYQACLSRPLPAPCTATEAVRNAAIFFDRYYRSRFALDGEAASGSWARLCGKAQGEGKRASTADVRPNICRETHSFLLATLVRKGDALNYGWRADGNTNQIDCDFIDVAISAHGSLCRDIWIDWGEHRKVQYWGYVNVRKNGMTIQDYLPVPMPHYDLVDWDICRILRYGRIDALPDYDPEPDILSATQRMVESTPVFDRLVSIEAANMNCGAALTAPYLAASDVFRRAGEELPLDMRRFQAAYRERDEKLTEYGRCLHSSERETCSVPIEAVRNAQLFFDRYYRDPKLGLHMPSQDWVEKCGRQRDWDNNASVLTFDARNECARNHSLLLLPFVSRAPITWVGRVSPELACGQIELVTAYNGLACNFMNRERGEHRLPVYLSDFDYDHVDWDICRVLHAGNPVAELRFGPIY